MIDILNRNLGGSALSLRDSVKQIAAALGPVICLLLCATFSVHVLVGQSTTTGAIAGVIQDPSSAVIAGATVTLHNVDSGATQTATTNDAGAYQFSLLAPGNYTVQATFTGLKSDVTRVNVLVGAAASVNIVAKVQSQAQEVEVTSVAGGLSTESADLTTSFSTNQLREMPMPGGDITTVAFTVPGIVMSTGMGYGNFSSHGLGGTSNLFTMNGDDYNDPYLNLNNSGASNLLLGQTEVAEATVTQNGYSVQYGRMAGAQVNFVTKGGTNQIHADLLYNFNNHLMNANDFFANEDGTPKPYAVSQQWGADIGGPIIKNKLFFYSDSEGLYYTLPSVATVVIPSMQLENYILGTVNSASVPIYKQAFSIYNLGYAKGATNITTGTGSLQDATGNLGCGGTPAAANGLTGIAAPGGGTFGVNVPCGASYGASGLNTNKEWLQTHRVDWNINDKQKIYFRFKGDHGFQPTGTNLLTPALNEQSIQPQYEGQINHTYIVSPTQVNNFIVSFLWYSAIFGPANQATALNAFPSYFSVGGAGGANTGGFYPLGDNWTVFPQGRDSGQGQIVDDYSWIHGKHAFKFGVNYRRNRITDYSYHEGLIGSYFFNSLGDFANGVTNPNTGSEYFQTFSPLQDAHIRFYNIGIYAQDEWNVKSNLKVTFGLRMDRTANPTCLDNCFSNLNSPFSSSAFQKGADIPYDQSIKTGLSQAYYSTNPIVPNPRLGIVWSPGANASTVIRAGVGLFADLAPGFLVSNVFRNAPYPFTVNIADGSFVGASASPGSSAAEAQNQFNAFKTGFFSGQTLAQLNSSIQGGFSPIPYFAIPQKFETPEVIEWNVEIQHSFGAKNVLVATYSGNHGYNLLVQNGFLNAYVNTANFPNGFGGLPTTAPDPRFAAVTQLGNGGISNYDGLSVQYRRAFGYGFQGQASYTWSHALDDVSNGGSGLPYSACSGCAFTTLGNPVLSQNYGASDYDIRHSFIADFVWDLPYKFSNKVVNNVLGGWTLSGKFFVRSGTPFTIYDGNLAGLIAGTNINASANFAGSALPATAVSAIPGNCSRNAVNTPCFTASQFLPSGSETTFGNVGRNSIYGPHYEDIDASLMKSFRVKERLKFSFGAQAYNLVNHPNFQGPLANIANPTGFGSIAATAIPPTSAYGSFQGSAVSGRVMVVTGRLNF
jgi:Carboxypeptidase regulatory-like domain